MEFYIISKQRIIYMENKKIKWIFKLRNKNDYKGIISHLKEIGVRYSIIKWKEHTKDMIHPN